MFKIYACILAMWCSVQSIAFAQAPSITIDFTNFNWSHCLNQKARLGIVVNGSLNADNRFSIQIRKNESSPDFTEVPATLVNEKLEFVISDSLNYANSEVQFRVAASSPKTVSDWTSSRTLYSKGRIIINPNTSVDTVNAFDDAYVRFTGYSLGQVTVTMSDSNRFYFHTNSLNFTTDQILTPGGGEYTIAHAENQCGAMLTSGSYRSVVNQTSIKVINASPLNVCENGEVNVRISTLGPPLTSQTRFRLRFSEAKPSGTKAAIAESPATAAGNVITARFPSTFKLARFTEFFVQVITENPSSVSSSTATRIFAVPAPSARFDTPSQTLTDFGIFTFRVNTTGLPPFTVELTDGSTASSHEDYQYFTVFPLKDQSYSIKSVSSGCGKLELTEPQTLQLKVKQGIEVDESGNGQVVCAGSKARIRFVTSAQLTDATKFKLRVKVNNPSETFEYDAVRSGDYLEVTLPQRAAGYDWATYQILTTNPTMVSREAIGIQTQTIPTIRYDGAKNPYKVPGRVALSYKMKGGGPYTVEEMDGTVRQFSVDAFDAQQLFLKQTTDFKVKSVSNGCFKNENPGSVRLSLVPTEEPGIYLEPVSRAVCNNDSLEVVFGTVGKFGSGNKFSVQLYADCCEYRSLAVFEQGGKYKVKISAQNSGNAYLRISSTNPVLFSTIEEFNLQNLPGQFSLYPPGTAAAPARYMLSSVPFSMSVNSSSLLTSVVYTENGVEKTFNNSESFSNSIPVSPKIGELTNYTIKTGTNACGTSPVNLTTFIQLMPYRIVFSPPFNNNIPLCHGSPVVVPFGITEGNDTGASYTLQIGRNGASEYTTLQTGETGRVFRTSIPETITPGRYNLRIISSDGAISDFVAIDIASPPTATLRYETEPGQGEVTAGQQVRLKLDYTGTPLFRTIMEDNSVLTISSLSESYLVYPTKSQRYAIRSVSNVCGYGTASGGVDVKVKPKLELPNTGGPICEGTTFEAPYALLGDADLSDDYIRFSLVNYADESEIPLDSTKKPIGTISLKMPQTLSGSYYVLRVTVRKYNLSSNYPVSVSTKPSLTLSGNTVINNGESTYIVIKANKYIVDRTTYTLSDGTKGELYSSPGTGSYVEVSPKQTTTYTIASTSNSCGRGIGTGSATVEVNPPSARSVSVVLWSSATGTSACTGDTILISYKAIGSFSASNVMTAQISDTTGRNFRPIVSIKAGNALKAVLPADVFAGKGYRIRVVASDPNTASGAYAQLLVPSRKATARFASETVVFDGKTNPRITVLLEGGAPWSYQYGTDLFTLVRHSETPTDVIELMQASPNQYYKLFWVANGCGNGTIGSPSTVKVEVITATEPTAPGFQVIVAPNPVQDILTVKSENGDDKTIQLISQSGAVVRILKTRQHEERLDIRNLPSGIYLLHIDAKGRKATFKVIKQ